MSEAKMREALSELVSLWIELGKVCEMVPQPGWQDEKAAYEEYARHLTEVMSGNMSCIEKI